MSVARAGLCLALACCAVSSCVVPCHHVLCCAARVVGVLMPKIVMNITDTVLSGSEIVVIISISSHSHEMSVFFWLFPGPAERGP